jgi:hypothetical protein
MPPPSNGRSLLQFTQLEARETPSAVVSESFDTARFPFKPAGWQEWASNGEEYYATTRNAATSGQQALAIYGNIDVRSRLWNATSTGSDVAVRGQIRSDAPAPILLFARGSNLTGTAANYAGVAVTADRASIVESVNGVERIVTTRSFSKIPTAWLSVQYTLTGDRLAATIQRADTRQYLTAAGGWQSNPTEAIAATVTVRGSGQAGIGRLPGAYGTAYVDDFQVSAIAAPTAPPVVPPVVPPVSPPIVPPVVPHTVPPPASPAPTGQNYSHIRLAQLAYESTAVGNFEKQLAANSIDLIVPNPKFLEGFESVAADSAKYLYSNASNLYLNLLSGWIAHATRTGADREAAFYHVSQATPFTGNSPSAQPVNWLWNVSRGAANGSGAITDLTSHARAGRNVGVTFGGVGEAITIGQLDRFGELNFTMQRSKQTGWAGAWEYVSAVDANGKPTAWKALPITVDGTNGLARNGQIAFDPPKDWAPSLQANGTARLYTLRLRTTAGTAAQAPEAKSIFGRDYVGAKGKTTGTIPAFDYASDKDGDGYLNDREYGFRKPGFDARFVHETRLFYPYYGQMRFVANPTSAAYKSFAAEYHAGLLAAAPSADGIFLDNASGRVPFESPVLESTANFTAESAAVVAAIRARIGGKTLVANTAGGRTDANAITSSAGIAYEEFLLRPNAANWSQVNDVAAIVAGRLASHPTAAVVLDSLPASTANMTDPRTQLGALSYYYLLADPQRTYLMIWGGYAPSAQWSQKWIPAAAVDVGKPAGAMGVFAEGKDPQNAKLTYKVYSRDYGKALVLFKPVSYLLGQGTGTTADATATTHQLNGNYRELRANGSLGPVVQQITLRNGEGAVLMKA